MGCFRCARSSSARGFGSSIRRADGWFADLGARARGLRGARGLRARRRLPRARPVRAPARDRDPSRDVRLGDARGLPEVQAEIVSMAFGNVQTAPSHRWGVPTPRGSPRSWSGSSQRRSRADLVGQFRSFLASKVTRDPRGSRRGARGLRIARCNARAQSRGSTFSLEVDRARFTLARDRLAAGERLGRIAPGVGLSSTGLSALFHRTERRIPKAIRAAPMPRARSAPEWQKDERAEGALGRGARTIVAILTINAPLVVKREFELW